MLTVATLLLPFSLLQHSALAAVDDAALSALLPLEDSSPAPLQVAWERPGRGPSLVRGFDAGPYGGEPAAVATAFLAEHGAALGLLAAQRQWLPGRELAWHGRLVVHLGQSYSGVPVIGGALVVKVEPDGGVAFVSARPVDGLDLPVIPALSAADALVLAQCALPVSWADHSAPALAILPTAAGGRLIYELRVETSAPPATRRVRIDAQTGEVIEVADQRVQAAAQVYEHNPVNSDLVDVTLVGLQEADVELTGDWANASSVVFTGDDMGYEHLAQADDLGDFYFEPDDETPVFDDPFAEVNAYWHITQMALHFSETFGHVFDGPARLYTNYRESATGSYDNAYFSTSIDGTYMIALGQGAVDLAYDADVMQHEFGHGIVDDLTDINSAISYPFGFDEYGFAIAPHAMNEGMADYWSSTMQGDACSAEYFGQGVYGPMADCLRDLENDLRCPEDVYGEPHWDGQVVGAAAWDVHELLGAALADDVMYGALSLLTPTHSFAELGHAVLESAGTLVSEGTITLSQWEAMLDLIEGRGIMRCGRWIDMEEGVPETSTWLGADIVASYLGSSACTLGRSFGILFPLPFQYAFTTPPASAGDLKSLTFNLALERLDGGEFDDDDLLYSAYVRKGDMVEFETYNLRAMLAFDYTIVREVVTFDREEDDAPTSITIKPGDADLPLEPDTTYYISFAGLNCPSHTFELTADVELVPPEEGCGCASGARGSGSLALLGLLPLLGLRRRKRAAHLVI